jgi:hypothetical protein
MNAEAQAIKQKNQAIKDKQQSTNQGKETLTCPIIVKLSGYSKTAITDKLAHLCGLCDFLAAYSDESIYQKDMTEQMNEEFTYLRE